MKGLHLKFQEIKKTLTLNRTKNLHRLFKLLRDTKRHEKLLKISRIIATSTNDEKKPFSWNLTVTLDYKTF